MDVLERQRLQRERQFHNTRFSTETKRAQSKYYWALSTAQRNWEQRIIAAATGGRVLEYGCAQGLWSMRIARHADRVDAIDISDVAIMHARSIASAEGLSNVYFETMDAHATTFPDQTFDLVFGSGIIHHLDTERSLREIHRILKKGGVAVFIEPLGCNPLINAYRYLTPSARTPDEHPLVPADKRLADSIFSSSQWDFHGLATLGTVPFRNTSTGIALHRGADGIDRMIARIPGARWQLWFAVVSLER
ncbi:class I SAM-dependent methyltransferase [Aerolutibacter ruishenii]|uniref:Ubiquinone/menaquinone biosynthesis C-methylase UbiE n=1 Tax=Aerolutibacter ruishenii TaxID=686800 RepID=A0A562LRW9_9GAMM|nr:class I SAM-dependent methyltransferase [Lysobacter ruishenii]TWI10342.1 ubiquinone/menaquinone biosynthesis C-methylase UbiE [Lysobacter ruishenii]